MGISERMSVAVKSPWSLRHFVHELRLVHSLCGGLLTVNSGEALGPVLNGP